MKYDYVFVGAGPASLAAANLLLQRGKDNLLILEAGSAFSKRGCPGLSRSLCTHCNGTLCHVSGGEGGSSARFGNKLCYFPASHGVLHYLDQGTVNSAAEYLNRLAGPYFNSMLGVIDPSAVALKRAGAQLSDFSQKHYVSDILLRSDFEGLIHKLLSMPRQAGVLRLNTSVVDIAKNSDSSFHVICDTGNMIETRNVILACGRTSYKLLQGVFDSLGARWERTCPDVGIRLEGPREIFTSDFTYQSDPKYKCEHYPHGISRTFCGCNGGIIVPVKFGGSYYADGAFGDDFTDFSNLAFMVRSRRPISTDDLERWCRAVNAAAGGNLFLGDVFLDETDPRALVNAIMALVPCWPSEEHRIMMSRLLTLTLGAEVALLKGGKRGRASVKVCGPAIDLYWPRPKLARTLETTVRGLFVLGDATGASRGFVQAMVSGAAWSLSRLADSVRVNGVQSIRKEIEGWSVLG